LRLWDALWWDCEPEIMEDEGLSYSEDKQYAGQLSFWENE
jgi:hypothetical protein